MKKLLMIATLVALAACTHTQIIAPVEMPEAVEVMPVGDTHDTAPDTMELIAKAGEMSAAWAHLSYGKEWTGFVLQALADFGSPLYFNGAPRDAKEFCPNFVNLSKEQRTEFYVELISSMTKYESSFKAKTTYTEDFKDAKGKYVVSRGPLQISQESANGKRYKCDITKESQLHDPLINFQCGVKILAYWIPLDGNIGVTDKTSSSPNKGGARYWSVLRNKSSSRAKIIERTSALSFCKAS